MHVDGVFEDELGLAASPAAEADQGGLEVAERGRHEHVLVGHRHTY